MIAHSWDAAHDIRSYELIARVFNGQAEGLSRDDILDNITLYWLTNTAISSARLYWENKQPFFVPKNVKIPVAVSVFPDDIHAAPRSWAEKAYSNLIHYNKLPKGGHFAAWEQQGEVMAIGSEPVDMKLEVVILTVSDVDRAKAFYEKLGWRVDIDISGGDFRGVQITPHNSEASIIFGKGVPPGKNLVLAVDDIDAARAELIARGVDVSEVFHYAGGPFNNTVEPARVSGRDPEGRSYFSFVSFEDPDGNSWLVQEITSRLPGREWKKTQDTATLAELLHETAEHHDHYEKTHGKHDWWNWYAPYLSARQNGSNSEEAAAAADRYMDEVFHVPRL